MNQKSLFIEKPNYKLHLRNIYVKPNGPPVLMLHGSMENGKIFYTESGKGLACFLAEQGFNVFVVDYRGRGESKPLINAESDHGQYETINQDIPDFIDFVFDRCNQPIHVISHSWGGVLLASVLAKYPEKAKYVRTNICFGTKRTIGTKSLEKFLKVDLVWNRIAGLIAKKKGFLDLKKWNLGSDNESRKSLKHNVAWVKDLPWKDIEDGFHYGDAAEHVNWPATWHLTGINDTVLGNPNDVKLFIDETVGEKAKYSVLSKKSGNALDYDHINILTAKQCLDDHFPEVSKWMKEH